VRLCPLLLMLALADAGAARAEPFQPGQSLDPALVAEVAATALAFMAPRTLDPVPPSQLTLWGLRGLTALDTRLTTGLKGGVLSLSSSSATGERLVTQLPAPAEQDIPGWGRTAAAMIRAGWNASEAVRRAGTPGIIRTFFDEMFNHLDPYSRYASPRETLQDQAERSSEADIGATLTDRGAKLMFAKVTAAGTAAAAGIHSGDRLLAVDGNPVSPDDLLSAQQSLIGRENTTVTLTVRTRSGHEVTSPIPRMPIAPETVTVQRSGDAVLLRISGFARNTGNSLARALGKGLATMRAPRGLVLDLRGNRGGLLLQAVEAAKVLLPQGVIAVTAGRDPQAAHHFTANGIDQAHGLPVVVLVDGRSASAAEILAASLADQRRAVVVGSATLGKGLVQTIGPLPDGGELLVTWSRVLAPFGWPLQGLGVMPQVCTSMGQDATRMQLMALDHGQQTMARALMRSRTARAPLPPAETLEIRAACPAAQGRDEDLRTARFLIDHAKAYETALIGPAPPMDAGP